MPSQVDRLTEEQVRSVRYMIWHYRHAFRVRARTVIDGDSLPDPPVVRELINALYWLGDGMDIVQISEQAISLTDIIHHNGQRVKDLTVEARAHGLTDLSANEINDRLKSIRAANTLLELLDA